MRAELSGETPSYSPDMLEAVTAALAEHDGYERMEYLYRRQAKDVIEALSRAGYTIMEGSLCVYTPLTGDRRAFEVCAQLLPHACPVPIRERLGTVTQGDEPLPDQALATDAKRGSSPP